MSLDPSPKPLQEAAHSGCAGGCSAAVTTTVEIPAAADPAQSDGVPVFVIPTMDCPNEENDIRRAVAGIDGIRFRQIRRQRKTLASVSYGEVFWRWGWPSVRKRWISSRPTHCHSRASVWH